jgi:hypothetical protein
MEEGDAWLDWVLVVCCKQWAVVAAVDRKVAVVVVEEGDGDEAVVAWEDI